MSEYAYLAAASEAEVSELVGLGRRDPDLAERWWAQISRIGVDDSAQAWDNVDLAARTILWDGGDNDDALPYDGPADSYWNVLGAMVDALSWYSVDLTDVAAAGDLDALFASAGVAATDLPTRLAHRPQVPFPMPHEFDVRVIGCVDATRITRAWLAAETGEGADLTTFCRRFGEVDDEARAAGRPEPDLWVFVPAVLPQRVPFAPLPFPPPPVATIEVPDELLAVAGMATPSPTAEPAPTARPEVDAAFTGKLGRYSTGKSIYPEGVWSVEWRFEDGTVRVCSQPADGEKRWWYGTLQEPWGRAFDLALRAANFPTQPDRAPLADENLHTLALGSRSVIVPAGVAAEEPWHEVFRLLDALICTLAPEGSFHPVAGAEPDPDYVRPL